MSSSGDQHFRRPGWNQAGLWMGADLFSLLGILTRNGWRVHPAYWFDCAVDLTFAAGNSCLRALQAAVYGSRVRREST